MNFTGYLCFGSLTVMLVGLVFHNLYVATVGFMLLVLGMWLVAVSDE